MISSLFQKISDQMPPEDSGRPEHGEKDHQAECHETTTMQFVLIKASSHPPDNRHKNIVRSHVMKAFHSHRRKQQTRPARNAGMLQKRQHRTVVGSSKYRSSSTPASGPIIQRIYILEYE
jgi:hypothetical protein